MADVTIKYKDNVIAEIDGKGSKTLNTSGCYCEGNVAIEYAPRSRTYEVTLAKSSGGVLLTTLDEDVLAHINDENFTVLLTNTSPFEYVWYSGNTYFCGNKKIGTYQTYTQYGLCHRHNSETVTAAGFIVLPANNTSPDNLTNNAMGLFYISGNKYYLRPGDGFISAGTYRLTFNW